MASELYRLMTRGKLQAHVRRIVLGGVIDDEDSGIHTSLGEDAVDTSGKEVSVVIAGDDDVDARQGLMAAL